MYVYKYLAPLLIVFVVACSSSIERRDPVPDPDFPEKPVDQIYIERFVIEDFQNRLQSAANYLENGNGFLFRATRDSLRGDVNSYIHLHPHFENNPEFVRILNQLVVFDTLTVNGTESRTSKEDSLALAFADWPDLDIKLDDGQLFDSYNTVFPRIENRRINFWIKYYTGPGKKRFERAVYRMQLYRPIVEEILSEMDLPRELIWVVRFRASS